jgi:hypothetical protein
MNFNFNFKDMPARRTRQSATSQPLVIAITRVISGAERFWDAAEPYRFM